MKFSDKQIFPILGHRYKDNNFTSVDLSGKYFSSWKEGRRINSGDVIAEIGGSHENGGWLPRIIDKVRRHFILL